VHIGDSVVSNAVVIAYGVTVSGIRDVLAIDVVDTESKRAGRGFSKGCDDALVTGSSVRSSLSAIAHEGLKAAIAVVFQGASWQRCKVHFFRNILAHVPQARKLDVAAGLRNVFTQVSNEAAQRAATEFRERFGTTLVKAVAIFDSGLVDALAFLRFPLDHHRKIATTNPIEHLNREIRRRTRSIGIFPSPESALRIITMILVEQREGWMVDRRYMLQM